MRTGDDLIPKAVRNHREVDPVLIPTVPKVRELIPGSGIWEPVDETGKVYPAPVFLVDPKFTKEMPEEQKTFFEDNDFGGYLMPVVPTKWPILHPKVQQFF